MRHKLTDLITRPLAQGWRWRVLRLTAITIAVVAAQLSIGNGHAHVHSPNPTYQTQFQKLLDDGVGVPYYPHASVVSKAPIVCEGALGCTFWHSQLIYVNPHQSKLQLNVSFLHELGHQWDFRKMDNADRRSIKQALNLKGYWWNFDDWTPPGEIFAEAYAWCGVHIRPTAKTLTAYGYHPSIATYEAVCAAILRTDD